MRAVRSFGIILAASLAAVVFAGPASGQVRQEQPVSALKGHNSNAPVDVTADRIEVQDRADRAIFAGNVQLTRGANVVNGRRLVINLDSGRAVVDGGPPGVNASGGRVTGHFTVPQKNSGS